MWGPDGYWKSRTTLRAVGGAWFWQALRNLALVLQKKCYVYHVLGCIIKFTDKYKNNYYMLLIGI